MWTGYEHPVDGRDRTRKTSNTVTMHMVAALAGVSPMSVSNVINGRNVRPKTREAVLEAIEKLKYKPNIAARALASASTLKIGLIYNSPESAFVSALLVGALDAATRCGAQLLIRRYGERPDQSLADVLHELVVGDGANALLLTAPYCERVSGTGLLAELGVPVVALCAGDELPDMLSVRVDDFAAAKEMTTHLLGLGHRRIGFIRSARTHTAYRTRYEGYRGALEALGIPYDPALVVKGAFTFDSGLTATEALLALPDPPTAIFASNDDMAAAVVSVAHRRGLRIPDELSVAGFDDSPISRKVWPQITTIRQPIVEMTRLAVDILRQLFEAAPGDPEPQASRQAHTLIQRPSTGQSQQPPPEVP